MGQETVAVFRESNIKRDYQTRHAIYNKLIRNERCKKNRQIDSNLGEKRI